MTQIHRMGFTESIFAFEGQTQPDAEHLWSLLVISLLFKEKKLL